MGVDVYPLMGNVNVFFMKFPLNAGSWIKSTSHPKGYCWEFILSSHGHFLTIPNTVIFNGNFVYALLGIMNVFYVILIECWSMEKSTSHPNLYCWKFIFPIHGCCLTIPNTVTFNGNYTKATCLSY